MLSGSAGLVGSNVNRKWRIIIGTTTLIWVLANCMPIQFLEYKYRKPYFDIVIGMCFNVSGFCSYIVKIKKKKKSIRLRWVVIFLLTLMLRNGCHSWSSLGKRYLWKGNRICKKLKINSYKRRQLYTETAKKLLWIDVITPSCFFLQWTNNDGLTVSINTNTNIRSMCYFMD